jgi:hypothetical protein
MSAIKNKSNNLVSLLLLILVALTLWLVRGVGDGDGHLMLMTLAGVASGCLLLGLLRPQRVGLSPPNVMLTLGIGGMLLGLLWDGLQTPLAMIEALCVASNHYDLFESMQFHMRLLPGMHVMMVAGGLAAIPALRVMRPECRRLCSMLTQNILCSSWMLIGMTLGATVFVQSIRSLNGLALDRMLGGMFTGMVWGMAISVGVYRLFFILSDRLAARKHQPALSTAVTSTVSTSVSPSI